MILHPAVIALLVGSLLIVTMLVYAAFYGVQILRGWDISSGSELQLSLERKTYLISTLVTYAFGFQLISFFLFIYTSDSLCHLLVGAMCAAGTLSSNGYGYPALLLKLFNFILAGLWLIVNYTDNQSSAYPLIRKKYGLLLVITPFMLAEAVVQGKFFLNLQPNVITSCCGSLFSEAAEGITADIVAFPAAPTAMVFAVTMLVTLALGLYHYLRGKGGYCFAIASATVFVVSIAAILSFISPYIYELPTHHCPFCILQREYGYVGYLLYGTLLGGAVTGMGVGILQPFRTTAGLATILPAIQKSLSRAALILYGVFCAVVLWQIIFSELRMG
jgi:hypothetical protein